MTEGNRNNNQQVCKECERHCPMDDLHCGRGRRAAGLEKPENRGEHHEHGKHDHHSHDLDEDAEGDAGLYVRLRQCGHYLFHNGKERSSQRRVLAILAERDGTMSQRELTEELGTHRASVSELLGKLEKKEYINRSQDEQDRRQVQIAITEKGKAELQKDTRNEGIQEMQNLFAVLSEEEKNNLYEILNKLVKDWKDKERSRDNK